MYLLYCDESGDVTNVNDRAVVVAGVAVHEEAVRPLAGRVNEIIAEHVGKKFVRDLELHGSPLRVGRHGWQVYSSAKRASLYKSLLDLLCDWQHEGSGTGVRVFATVVDRAASESPFETGYGELLHVFDEGLRQGRRGGNPHNGVLIADRGKYEKWLSAWVELARARYRRPAQDNRRLYALVENPFFVDSRSTRLMQLADLVAHAFYRGFQSSDWEWAEHLQPAFEPSRGGSGLHLVPPGTECHCFLCADGSDDTATLST
ncbi:MAG: DUF3800 domain-containing protein [Thermoleophilia bacterium]